MRRLRDDDGSILPLTIFFGFLSLVLILLVVAATSLYLERKRLYTLADGAALVGAEAFELSDVTAGPNGVRAQLSSAAVKSAVREYVAEQSSDFLDLSVVRAGSDDARSATVTLGATWAPPLLSPLVPSGLRIEVTSTARSVFS